MYSAKLKTRKQLDAEEARDAKGWWYDVCPGATLQLRDATESDISRCFLREGSSRNPADYLCELPADGALVARIAISSIEPT